MCSVADTELTLINMLLQEQFPPTVVHKVFKGVCI